MSGSVSGLGNGYLDYTDDIEDSLAALLVAGALTGALAGLLGTFIVGALYYSIGKWIGGKGTLWDPLTSLVVLAYAGHVGTMFILPSMLVYLAVLVWSLVISVPGMAEAHQFSSWRSLATWLLCGLFLTIVVFAVVFAVFVLVLAGS